MRCVGAAGTGHGAWSQSVPFETPQTQQAAPNPGQALEATLPPLGSSKFRRSARDLRQLDGEDAASASSRSVSVRRSNSRSLGEHFNSHQSQWSQLQMMAHSYHMPAVAILWLIMMSGWLGMDRVVMI